VSKPKPMKTDALAVPSSREEAEQLLADIGRLQRQVTTVESGMNDRLSKVKAEYELKAKPLNDEISDKFRALHVWAEANRHDLLKGRAKTAKLATGEVSWRITPPSVRITGVKVVIERLKQLGLHQMLRSKEEPNKEAILAAPDKVEGVKGISITQREEFVAKPFESQIERVEVVR